MVSFRSVLFFFGFLFVNFYSYANYAPKVINPNDGYRITINGNSILSQTPIYGTDGTEYYKLGDDVEVNSSGTPVTGQATCIGTVWGGNTGLISEQNGWHNLYIYAPLKNGFIDGKRIYQINKNTVMTVNSDMAGGWIPGPGANTCSSYNGGFTTVGIEGFYFKIIFSFYVNERVVDNQIVIPAMNLAGYVRAFMDPNVSPNINSWEFENTSAPIRLESSTINFPSSCSTSTSTGQPSTVELRHGHLNTLNYDSEVTEKVTYTCKFSKSTKVRLRLDYAKDNDPQKRLPLINKTTNEKIYTTLLMTDESTGQSGLDMNVDIENLKTININSHLQGTKAPAGDYQGSAWLIATFL
jgi:hypothetical protein